MLTKARAESTIVSISLIICMGYYYPFYKISDFAGDKRLTKLCY